MAELWSEWAWRILAIQAIATSVAMVIGIGIAARQ
ncbi:hypothetical protein DFR37_103378 [Eoetvoesiella caeni]|uniref:Uncharacterized protein n=1 Tax=Eoetvoesiella caeni TaxID=645616 RepID=A0A366HHM0_9BURK|nr:hypothetical protein DFR37_103378 [Eoetvoesiella caeni]